MASTETVSTTPGLQHALLQSCHQTLIHLGDLSRYQEFELGRKEKDRNWGPAIGYYDLAIAVNPSSGTPFNQLAIISKAEDDHARALYYLYRAQSAFEPPSTAWANLQLEFKKIREASERKSSAAGADRREGNPLADLQRRLPLLHARCFGGIELAEYDELESSVLGQLTDGLKEWSLETSFVNRMVLSNVAADFTAGDRWQGKFIWPGPWTWPR